MLTTVLVDPLATRDVAPWPMLVSQTRSSRLVDLALIYLVAFLRNTIYANKYSDGMIRDRNM